MIRKSLFAALAVVGLCAGGYANEAKTVAVVNFANCITESKFGKQEQASFDSLKTQMTSLLEDTEKQLSELAAKFNDSEYMDGLSPEAEEEMKVKYQQLSEEMNRYQNQYYQVLQQANMKIVQTMGANIQEASEKVAKNKKLTMVINKEACFFFTPTLDVTDAVIAEMDKAYDAKKVANNQPAENQNAPVKK
ncbi:MAG: OmpH family outer membrane protein [Verrucomicrobia bacterium]|nr:OmpH family outer membrane protein [Verrucomicrobiota bacterium]